MTIITPISAFKDNYIWMLSEPDSSSVWVVDPGDANPVIDVLNKSNLTLAGILLTHHHNDHSGGIRDLINYAGKIPVYGGHNSPITLLTHHVINHDYVICNGFRFQAIAIPGHTLDHTAYYGNYILFCGDTLFSAGCGKIFEGTPEQMYTSLQRLAKLPDETKIYCGHEYTLNNLIFSHHVEPNNAFISDKIESVKKILEKTGCTLPSILSEEKMMNPFLRCDQSEIINSVSRYVGKKVSDPIEVFSYLREWKNNFQI